MGQGHIKRNGITWQKSSGEFNVKSKTFLFLRLLFVYYWIADDNKTFVKYIYLKKL